LYEGRVTKFYSNVTKYKVCQMEGLAMLLLYYDTHGQFWYKVCRIVLLYLVGELVEMIGLWISLLKTCVCPWENTRRGSFDIVRQFIAFLRAVAQSVCHFPQNAIYLIVSYFWLK